MQSFEVARLSLAHEFAEWFDRFVSVKLETTSFPGALGIGIWNEENLHHEVAWQALLEPYLPHVLDLAGLSPSVSFRWNRILHPLL